MSMGGVVIVFPYSQRGDEPGGGILIEVTENGHIRVPSGYYTPQDLKKIAKAVNGEIMRQGVGKLGEIGEKW